MDHILLTIRDWEPRARQAQHKASVLAKLCGVSLRHLERFFHSRFACCPHKWLDHTRLNHALELLAKCKTAKEVAPVVGLASASSLCQFFNRTTGLSPGKYLKRLRATSIVTCDIDTASPGNSPFLASLGANNAHLAAKSCRENATPRRET